MKNIHLCAVPFAALAMLLAPATSQAQDLVTGRCYTDSFLPTEGGDQVYDVEISLYKTPTTSERALYEDVLRHFARAVYEMTNGSQLIRNVIMHQDGKQKRFADVVWGRGVTEAEEQAGATAPHAVAHAGGILRSLAKIYLFEHEQDATIEGGPQVDMVHESAFYREMLGHILAHEFGHYAFSIADEYVRFQPSGFQQVRSIMSSQRRALERDTSQRNFQWLNFATEVSERWAELAGSTFTVGQFDRWGGPSWEFLQDDCFARYSQHSSISSTIHPDTGDASTYYHFPEHVYYPGVAAAAPELTDAWVNPNDGQTYLGLTVELQTPPPANDPATQHLDVTWSDSNVEMELILDASGSMEGQPIANVRLAAQGFVDKVALMRTALGVTTFASTPDTAVQPMVAIDDVTSAEGVKTAIGGIVTGDNTAMFAAALEALQKLENYRADHNTNALRVAFLLSDGHDNFSGEVTEQQVIDAYQAEGVRVHTVGYVDRDGSDGFFPPLENIAAATGGQFHRGITEVGPICEAMRIAFGDALTVQDLELEGLGCLDSSDDTCFSEIDMLYTQMSYELAYTANPGGGVSFDVLDPNGNSVSTVTSTIGNADGSLTTTLVIGAEAIVLGGTGRWSVRANHMGAGVAFLDKKLHATPGTGSPVELVVNTVKSDYVYPEPILIFATALLDGEITGLTMTAELVSPSGVVHSVPMNDAGIANDGIPSDGMYAGQFADYDEDGVYTLTVVAKSDGNASLVRHPAEHGPISADPSVTLEPLNLAFTRRATLELGIDGIKADDHGNTTDTATVIAADYAPHHGKLETSGDIDFFQVEGIDISRDLSIRLYEGNFGIAPAVTVYDGGGKPVAFGNVFTASTAAGYISLRVDEALLEPVMFFSVADLNDNAGGTYTVSAGASVNTDAVAPTLLNVTSRDPRPDEDNVSGIELDVENISNQPVSDFTVVYYFDTEFFQVPILEDWWSAIADVSLVERGSEQYAVEFDYTGLTLEPGESLPFASENSIGLHYADWSVWDTGNDFSNNGSETFADNLKIAVYNHLGHLIYGEAPFLRPARSPIVDVVALSREDKLADPAWSGPDIYIANRGDDISDFVVYYYFAAENEKDPLLDVWDSPNAAVSLEILGGDQYRIKYDYTGFELAHTTDSPWPSRTLVGLHYADWSPVDITNDASNNGAASYQENTAIEIYDSNGNRIFGTL